MRRIHLSFLGAAALALTAALPASADVHQIGAVNVSADHYTDVSWSRFDGPVAHLRFVADNDTIDCDHIDITYRDGTTHEVFSGILPRDSIETVAFPEGDSRIRRVDFACKAENRDGARITLSALSQGEHWQNDMDGRDTDWDRSAHVRTYEDRPVVREYDERVPVSRDDDSYPGER